MTLDNESANLVMVKELENLLGSDKFSGVETHVRCAAHIINLVVKAMMTAFGSTTDASLIADAADLEEARASEAAELEEVDEDQECNELDEEGYNAEEAALLKEACSRPGSANIRITTVTEFRLSLTKVKYSSLPSIWLTPSADQVLSQEIQARQSISLRLREGVHRGWASRG
jgi:hypothetical protein